MPAKVNIEVFAKIVIDRADSYQNFMFYAAKERFRAAYDKLFIEFDQHAVTKEIKDGPDSKNRSVVTGFSNLFAFIGFNAGEDPIGPLRELLQDEIQLRNRCDITKGRRKVTYAFDVEVPSKEDITGVTRLEYNPSKSWVWQLESGFWGLSHYIFGLLLHPPKTFSKSRSGTGLEVKGEVRANEAKPTPYISELLERFYQRCLGNDV